MARIGGFRGVRQDINPSRLEPGQLQDGANLRFVKAGQLEAMRADTEPNIPWIETGVSDFSYGLHEIRNPYTGFTNYVFKVGTKVMIAADVDDVGPGAQFKELYDSGENTPISVFSVDDWIYIYDEAGSKKWDGLNREPQVLWDLDAGNDYSTLEAAHSGNVAGGFMCGHPDSEPYRYYHCIRDIPAITLVQLIFTNADIRFPYFRNATSNYQFKDADDPRWFPVSIEASIPTTSRGAWAGSTVYNDGDTVYLTDAIEGPTQYFVMECRAGTHTSTTVLGSRENISSCMFLFWWAPLDGTYSDYLDITYPDWGSVQPDGLSSLCQTPYHDTYFGAAIGKPDYIPNEAEYVNIHGFTGTYFYRYRYVLKSTASEGNESFPLYVTPFFDLTDNATPVEATPMSFIRIDYDLAPPEITNGYGTVFIEIYRSKDFGGYNSLYLLAALPAQQTEDSGTTASYYDSTGDEGLGAAASAYDIDFIAPPSSSLAAFAAQRIFVAIGRKLYWSYLGFPGRFNSLQQASFNDTITGIVEWGGDVYFFTPSSLWVYRSIDAIGVVQRTGSNVGTSKPHSIVSMRDAIYFTRNDGVWAFDGATARLISAEVMTTWEDAGVDFEPVACHTGRRLFVLRGESGLTMDLVHGSPDWCPITRSYPGGGTDYVLGAASTPGGTPVLLAAKPNGGSSYTYRLVYVEKDTGASDQTSYAVTGEMRAPKNNQPIAVSVSYTSSVDISFTVKVRNQLGAIQSTQLTLPATGGLKRLLRTMMPYTMVGEAVWFEVEGKGFVLDDIYVEAA